VLYKCAKNPITYLDPYIVAKIVTILCGEFLYLIHKNLFNEGKIICSCTFSNIFFQIFFFRIKYLSVRTVTFILIMTWI
jgi:hypothetical protein